MDGLQQVETADAGHANIADDDVRLPVIGQLVEQRAGFFETANIEILSGQGLLHDPANRAVVVDDPDGSLVSHCRYQPVDRWKTA